MIHPAWSDLSLVLTVGRSGSSCVTGLLHYHGKWIGKTPSGNIHNPDGYFENSKIKALQYAKFGRNFLHNVPLFAPFKDDVCCVLAQQGCDRPWVYKTGVQYVRCFDEFDVKYIKVRRDPLAIFDSYQRCGFLAIYSNHDIMHIIKRGLAMMDHIDGPEIHYERLLKHDYGELREALAYCNLTFDQRLTDEFVRSPT